MVIGLRAKLINIQNHFIKNCKKLGSIVFKPIKIFIVRFRSEQEKLHKKGKYYNFCKKIFGVKKLGSKNQDKRCLDKSHKESLVELCLRWGGVDNWHFQAIIVRIVIFILATPSLKTF